MYKASKKSVSVIGLGKLGLPLLVTMAERGFRAIGYDINQLVRDGLKRGKPHIFEPGINKLFKKNLEDIVIVDNIAHAVKNSEITFIITPTPSMKNGNFSTEFVEAAVLEIAKALKKKSKFHLVVLVSTVLPGACEKLVNTLTKILGKKQMKNIGFCYNPEFIALGNVINGLLKPDFILIGESDSKAGDLLEEFYKSYATNKASVARMNFVSAELAKISVNTFITTKISYANMLAQICENLKGADVDTITGALGLDSRIGKKYLRGGISFGGPCFPRDNNAFLYFAKKLGVEAPIPKATQEVNTSRNQTLLNFVKNATKPNQSLGILGMSYKPDTDVIEQSASVYIASQMLGLSKVNLYDPKAIPNCRKIFNDRVNYYESLEDCIRDSDVLLIMTLWPEIVSLKHEWLNSGNKTIIDPWRVLTLSQINYIAPGRKT